ncbi:hypothetical protein [Phytohabitans rumicis]|nr:hypothetical protein [Phytohabitans rumicis]
MIDAVVGAEAGAGVATGSGHVFVARIGGEGGRAVERASGSGAYGAAGRDAVAYADDGYDYQDQRQKRQAEQQDDDHRERLADG